MGEEERGKIDVVAPSGPDGDRVPATYLVQIEPGETPAIIEQALAEYAPVIAEEIRPGLYRVRLGEDPGPESVAASVVGRVGIRFAQPDYRYRSD